MMHHQHPLICTVIGLQGSHAADNTTSPCSSARLSATPNSTQTSSGPGSTDESWQTSESDHHRPDLTCDRVRHLCASCSQLLAGCIHCFEPYYSCMHIDTLLSQCAYTCLFVIVVAAKGHPESHSASIGGACRLQMAALRTACQMMMMMTKRVP